MQNLHFGQSFSFYWRSYFKAMFFNQGLPTSIGGDALRVLDVAGQGFRKRDVLYGVMPVSYTHLDVYKRQAWLFMPYYYGFFI